VAPRFLVAANGRAELNSSVAAHTAMLAPDCPIAGYEALASGMAMPYER
jgi:hypothetical protein